MGIKIVWKFKLRVKNFQCNLFLFYPFRVIVWICVFHKKVTHLDTFLNKLCSSRSMTWLIIRTKMDKSLLIFCIHASNTYLPENVSFWVLQLFSGKLKMLSLFCTRHPEEDWNTEKNAMFQDPYFLIRHTLGITKISTWKYSMCIQARNFDIYVLINGPKLGWKEAFLALKCSWHYFVPMNCKKHTSYCLFRFSKYI